MRSRPAKQPGGPNHRFCNIFEAHPLKSAFGQAVLDSIWALGRSENQHFHIEAVFSEAFGDVQAPFRCSPSGREAVAV